MRIYKITRQLLSNYQVKLTRYNTGMLRYEEA